MSVSLTITVTDAQAARAQVALGHLDNSVNPPVWLNATAADIRALLKDYVKSQVLEYETRLQAQAARDAIGAEVW